MVLVGKIVAFVGQVLIVVSSSVTSRKRTLAIQSAGMLTLAVANVFLGGFAGVVNNVISVVRNILFVYGKNSRIVVACLVAAYIGVTLVVESIVGFPEMFWMLPLVINVTFTLLGHLDGWQFKIMNGSLFILWLVYDLSVANYVSAPFDIANVAANYLAAYRIRRSLPDEAPESSQSDSADQ